MRLEQQGVMFREWATREQPWLLEAHEDDAGRLLRVTARSAFAAGVNAGGTGPREAAAAPDAAVNAAAATAGPSGTVVPVTFEVKVVTYRESHRTTYHVRITRSDRPATDLLDDTGIMDVFFSENLEHAGAEADAWRAFLRGASASSHAQLVAERVAGKPG